MAKRITFKVFLTIALLLLFSLRVSAGELRVIASVYPPYINSVNGRTLEGFTYDWYSRVGELIGLDSKIEIVPWPRALKIASENKNVLLLALGKTESRESIFDWAEPYQKDRLATFALSLREDIHLETPKDLAKYSIAVYRHGAAHFLLKKMGVSLESIAMVNSKEQLINLLRKERVDMVIDFYKSFEDVTHDALPINHQITKVGNIQLPEIDIGFAISKNSDPKWLHSINNAQETLRANGDYDRLVNKWFKRKK